MATEQQTTEQLEQRIAKLEKALEFYADFEEDQVAAVLSDDGWCSDNLRLNHVAKLVLGREVASPCDPLTVHCDENPECTCYVEPN